MTIAVETQKLMRLLSQVVLADGHIHETEIGALIQGCRDLGFTNQSGVPLSESHIRIWFEDYVVELKAEWAKERKDITLTRLILSLAEWPDKQAVVDTLKNISYADDDFHISEKSLISIVKTYWQYDGLDAPNSTIISS